MQGQRLLALAGVGIFAAWGCRGETARDGTAARSGAMTGDTAAPTISRHSVSDSAAGELVRRKEPAPYFERARSSFAQNQTARTASALRDASGYFNEVRDSAAVTVKEHLHAAASELDSLARVAERRGMLTLHALDAAFARANLVEAERHATRLDAAWARKDTMTAAEEVLMTVDHLERANKDAAVPADKYVSLQLADARRLGSDLLKHVPLTSAASMVRVQQDLRSAMAQSARHIRKSKGDSGS